jgi:hypothetical protein
MCGTEIASVASKLSILLCGIDLVFNGKSKSRALKQEVDLPMG